MTDNRYWRGLLIYLFAKLLRVPVKLEVRKHSTTKRSSPGRLAVESTGRFQGVWRAFLDQEFGGLHPAYAVSMTMSMQVGSKIDTHRVPVSELQDNIVRMPEPRVPPEQPQPQRQTLPGPIVAAGAMCDAGGICRPEGPMMKTPQGDWKKKCARCGDFVRTGDGNPQPSRESPDETA